MMWKVVIIGKAYGGQGRFRSREKRRTVMKGTCLGSIRMVRESRGLYDFTMDDIVVH